MTTAQPTMIIWTITDMVRQASDGLVIQAHWRCEASDGTNTVSSYGVLPLTRGPSFVAYDKLTLERVLGWVKPKLDAAYVEARLQEQLAALANPPTLFGVPW